MPLQDWPHAQSRLSGSRVRYPVTIAAIAVAYFATAKLGLSMAFVAKQVTAVWPPTGIALAAVLVLGYRVWPGVALGAFLANVTANESPWTACSIAIGNTLEAVVGAWLLHSAGCQRSLERLRDVLGLIVLAAVLSTTVSATVGVASLCLSDVQPWSAAGSLWLIWWVGDAMGDVVMAPLLLTWASSPRVSLASPRLVEAVALIGGMVAVSLIAFAGAFGMPASEYPLHYMVFPFIIWAALRFGQRGTAGVTFVGATLAIWSTVNGRGPFAMGTASQSLIMLQLFMAMVAVSALLLGAAISERDGARRRGAADYANLLAGEERLRLALEAGRMGVWDWDIATGAVKWSATLEAMYGLAPGGFSGTFDGFLALVHPDDRDLVKRAVASAVEHASDYEVEYRRLAADGSVRWMAGKGMVAFDEAGRPVRMTGVCTDISERKRAEEKFRLAVEAAPSAMIMVDQQARIVLANTQAELLFGYEPNEMIDQSIELLVPERFRATHIGARRVFLGDPTARAMGAGRDLYGRRKDGREFPIEIGLNPIRTTDGTFVLSAVVDLTARKQAEEALREADRRKDEFLGMLAHDLRNPLAALTNALRLLQLGVNNEDALALAERQVRRLTRLVEDVLDVARITQGKVVLRKEIVTLQDVVEGAAALARVDLARRGQSLEVSLPAEPVRFEVDRVRLEQVLGNLLDNAVKYAGDRAHVLVAAQRLGHALEIRVRDTGAGIALEDLPRIFEPFVQGGRARDLAAGGLGIGLAVVRSLVELHGGTVEARSAGIGRGTEVIVRLPASSPPTADKALPEPEARVPVTRPLHLLLVDDNPDVVEGLTAVLGAMGHHVRVAPDGPTALAVAETDAPDVILLDIGLPGMDGYEIARRLRQQPRLRRTALIALTGWGREEDRRRAREAGFDEHITKPFDPSVLEDVLRSLAPASEPC